MCSFKAQARHCCRCQHWVYYIYIYVCVLYSSLFDRVANAHDSPHFVIIITFFSPHTTLYYIYIRRGDAQTQLSQYYVCFYPLLLSISLNKNMQWGWWEFIIRYTAVTRRVQCIYILSYRKENISRKQLFWFSSTSGMRGGTSRSPPSPPITNDYYNTFI